MFPRYYFLTRKDLSSIHKAQTYDGWNLIQLSHPTQKLPTHTNELLPPSHYLSLNEFLHRWKDVNDKLGSSVSQTNIWNANLSNCEIVQNSAMTRLIFCKRWNVLCMVTIVEIILPWRKQISPKSKYHAAQITNFSYSIFTLSHSLFLFLLKCKTKS